MTEGTTTELLSLIPPADHNQNLDKQYVKPLKKGNDQKSGKSQKGASVPKIQESTFQNVDYFEMRRGGSGFSGFPQIQMTQI